MVKNKDIEYVASVCNTLVDEVGKVIVGKDEVLRSVTIGLLSNGNMLIEDFPGLAKTLMAKTFASALGCTFRRAQFTPDLLPADITGTYILDESVGDFKFRQGPIFTNILLADEINRAPPKTQAALLEAMQERQVTVEGITHLLPRPFIVLATQNPIEYEGTYPLPEAQIDRFLMKISIGYPRRNEEVEMLKRRIQRKSDEVNVKTIIDPEKFVKMQNIIESVHLDSSIQNYIVEIVTRTREDPRVMIGPSPRGSLALFKLSRALAAINNRDFVLPDDVKEVTIPVLRHRIILKPEARIKRIEPENILKKILTEVPVPAI